MSWFLKGLLIALGLFVISMVGIWIAMSFQTFPYLLDAGQKYQIDGRTYQVPQLPVATYKGSDEPSTTKRIPMLDKKLLKDLRELIDETFTVLQKSEIDFWVTGGTLISAELWGHLMCFDDDCDVAVDWKDREFLWSTEFAAVLEQHGLESFFLRGMSLEFATREGAAVRIRKKGTTTPTIDVFFCKETEDGKYAKVNTWSKDKVTFNAPETWESKDWVFPLQTKEIDGMTWKLPQKPREMLDQQYGEEWKSVIKVPKPLFQSHQWAFWISNLFKAWRVQSTQ